MEKAIYVAVQQFWCDMLREWIRNIPLALLRQIVADEAARGDYIWGLAADEMNRRRAQTPSSMPVERAAHSGCAT